MAKEVPLNDFGLLIAYVLPGFAALWGVSFIYPEVGVWLAVPEAQAPTIAGFLYATVASIAAGMTVSTVRWLLIDTLHHVMGVKQPNWDFGELGSRANAFEVLLDIHYKYYQFHANMLVSLVWVYGTWRSTHAGHLGLIDAGAFLLAVIFFLGSRDNLQKYYHRSGQLLRARRAAARVVQEA
jgi:hypothetical protein